MKNTFGINVAVKFYNGEERLHFSRLYLKNVDKTTIFSWQIERETVNTVSLKGSLCDLSFSDICIRNS